MRLMRPALCLCLCLLLPLPVGAATLEDLYTAHVPVAGRSAGAQAAAFREAMRDVLARATGRRDAGELESLATLVQSAERYVRSYQSVAGGLLAISFDGEAIESAIERAGLPYWGAERPLTLVWLAVDRGSGRRGLVTAGTPSAEKQALERVAARRGLPLAWPSDSDDLRGAFDAAWSGQAGSLYAAARRYGADGVLVGRVSASGPVAWSFEGSGGAFSTGGDLETGLHTAADGYAAVYASRTAGRLNELSVTVTGIETVEDLAAAQRALEGIEAVRGLGIRLVGPGEVVFQVSLRGDAAALAGALRRGGRLAVVDSAGLVFGLQR